MIIGIDFGTCFSSAALMIGMLPRTNYVKDTTGLGMPTLFLYNPETGQELFGEQCETPETRNLRDSVVRHIKRTIREDASNIDGYVTSGGKRFPMKYVIEKYLRFIINEAQDGARKSGDFDNTNIDEITITVPVGVAKGEMMAFEYNRLIRDTVMKITGLPERKVHILQEPVAAAVSYLYTEGVLTRYNDIQTVLVFDLGGGTLDVTVVEHDPSNNTYKIRAKEGDLRLGGNDWDAALAEEIMRRTGISSFTNPEEQAEFNTKITKLKVELSRQEECGIFFKHNGRSKPVNITRAEFEEICQDLIDRAMDVTAKALVRAGRAMADENETIRILNENMDKLLGPGNFLMNDVSTQSAIDSIDKIVLVGGGSNMPMIKDNLINQIGFDEDLVEVYEPSAAIAKGAAIYAKLQSRVLDIATATYGVNILLRGEQGPIRAIENLIFKGDEFPENNIISVTKGGYCANRDDQEIISISVYESNLTKSDCIEGILSKMTDGEANGMNLRINVPKEYEHHAMDFGIRITITLDVNGIVTLSVIDEKTNRQLGYTTSRT